ncbi:MAG: universal stress protein [Methanobacteriota archaeon]
MKIDVKTLVMDDIDRQIEGLTLGAGKMEPRPKEGPPGTPHPWLPKRILLAFDGSTPSWHALAWAREIAKASGSVVYVLHAVEAPEVYSFYAGVPTFAAVASLYEEERDRGRKVLDEAVAELRAAGVETEALFVEGSPAKETGKAARRAGVDLVVLGSQGRGGAERMLLGSVSDAVKDQVAASVLIAKGPPSTERILVPTDGSAASRRAAALAVGLAGRWGSAVTFLHVLPPFLFFEREKDAPGAEQVFRALGYPIEAEGLRYELVFGTAAGRIADATRGGAYGLVVMGSRGLSGLKRLKTGSVGNRVAHEARASVLLVKEAVAKGATP